MPNFRHRLTKAQQREYDRSNAVHDTPEILTRTEQPGEPGIRVL